MARPHSFSMTGAAIVCLVTMAGRGTLVASQDDRSRKDAPASQALTTNTLETQISTPEGLAPAIPLGPIAQSANRTFKLAPKRPDAFAEQVYQGRPYRMGHEGHDGSIAAILIGAVATIAGTAVLVYANRPECDARQYAGGCGYGTKVVGGAVLSGGIASLFVGALTW